jgi:alkylated DNA repair protein (DNA oxidative demethylase)
LKGKYMTVLRVRGFEIHKTLLDQAAQKRLIAVIRSVVQAAPLFRPDALYGKRMSVRMSAAGKYGWFSDATGYRYVTNHPNGSTWPEIPNDVLKIWDKVTGLNRRPECCLINFYDADARMGMHQDEDEADFKWPVVSISLGDDGLFRMGNQARGGKTDSVWLQSGDVVVMGGEARLAHHGVDRIRPGTSSVLKDAGRINLTLRVVD